MRNTLFLIALAVNAAYAQEQQWPRGVCDLMTPEEMRSCLATRPGDASGARSVRCDELAQHQMEMCLQQARRDDAASAGATAAERRDADKSERTPEKAATPREGTK